ncbi:hypothetical protein N9873_01160 [Akkermansiaceae bacterium]|nr:hypothetical protein [Akkermansiaceae bacterium]MDB4667751.1 hypothetical protein [Akkermansiaceae bacterium]
MGRLNTGACAQPAPSILLRDHGIPVTAQRLAVMRSVSAHPHGTAEVIGDHVRSEIGATSTEPLSHSFA